MFKLILLCVLSVSASGVSWHSDFKSASQAARESGKPMLVDFQAVWCYSCYFMEQHVLEKPAFLAAAQGLVLAKLDVDTEEGRRLRDEHRAGFLPSYLILSPEGKELGRIVGEQTEDDFLRKLKDTLGKPQDGPAQKLAALVDAGDLAAARSWRDSQAAADAELAKRDDWRLLSARLDLLTAKKSENAAAARAAFAKLAELESGCVLPYDAYGALPFIEKAGAAEKAELLSKARAGLERLASARVFGSEGERCADARSPVDALAQVLGALNDEPAKKALLARAVEHFGALQKRAGLGADRNLDDNARYFLDLAGRHDDLDAMFPRLIEAYPSDYVYAFRWAKSLHARARHAEALSLSETALKLSYGANRFSVVELRANILSGLDRKADARAFLEAEARAARARFPKDAERLEKQAKGL